MRNISLQGLVSANKFLAVFPATNMHELQTHAPLKQAAVQFCGVPQFKPIPITFLLFFDPKTDIKMISSKQLVLFTAIFGVGWGFGAEQKFSRKVSRRTC
jgi:hypothetical protein